METQETLASDYQEALQKDTICGISKRLVNGSIASGGKLFLTPFGFHAVNAGILLILMLVVGISIGPAIEGQIVKVAAVIKSFSIFAFFMSFWLIFHQRLLASTIYLTSLLIVYFSILQILSNSMYGSMAQLAILCLFQLSVLALITVIVTLICQKKEINILSQLS